MATAVPLSIGEPAGFTRIVREHQSMVFSIAYHFLRDRALAEEVAQDVFLRLYESRDAIASPEHVKYWLRKTATNLCIDVCRRRRFMPKIGLSDIPEPSAAERRTDPMLSGALRKLVASLPERWRALVILRYQEDMDLEEMAGVVGEPATAVKSQLARAMEFLREKASRTLGEMG